MAKEEELCKTSQYIVVEVSDRNHHLCQKVIGHENTYHSLVNGRSRIMVNALCVTMNERENRK